MKYGWKVYLNIALWKIGLRDILPSVWVNDTSIKENGDPLVDISKDKRFSFDARCTKRGGCWVRKPLADKLILASKNLPQGYRFHFFGGWRSIVVQWTAWLSNLENKKKENPTKSLAEVKRIARLTSACPENGFGPHQTGAAIDLTLVDKNGKELDMGTPFSDHSKRCATAFKGISKDAQKNRMILKKALEKEGILNYPGEWWHFSYGDRAWARYGGKKTAFYNRTFCKDYLITPSEKESIKKNKIHIKLGD